MIVPAHTSEQESNSSPSTRPLINSPIFLFNSIHPPTHQYNPSSYPPTHQSSISINPPTTIQPLPQTPLYAHLLLCPPPHILHLFIHNSTSGKCSKSSQWQIKENSCHETPYFPRPPRETYTFITLCDQPSTNPPEAPGHPAESWIFVAPPAQNKQKAPLQMPKLY